MRTNRWVRTLALVLLSAVVLAACGGAGAGDSSESGPDFSTLQFPTLVGVAEEEFYSFTDPPDPNGLYAQSMSAAWYLYLFSFLQEWTQDKPNPYTFEDVEISWSQSGSTWCWTIDYGEGSLKFCITDTGTSYELTLTESETLLMAGTLTYDGETGSVTLYAEPTNLSYAWQSATSAPYDLRITVTNLDAAYSTFLIVEVQEDGSQWRYTGETLADPYCEFWCTGPPL